MSTPGDCLFIHVCVGELVECRVWEAGGRVSGDKGLCRGELEKYNVYTSEAILAAAPPPRRSPLAATFQM
ncbi:hypothetical protein E2C01_023726 [Portunus trituberculatus]|uniref:Uncharacterized protein n=1 Tax=Portunus trituberculatus TaxID=210409 RepID=A0A5B7EAT2_PORTR|nr:hypothetical protein [Portunus trituberculatus]